MTTRESTGVSEGEKIWAELDANEGKPAAVVDQPETVAAAEPTATAAPAAQADASATATPDWQQVMDKVNGLESQLTSTTGRLRNAEGHIGNLNAQLKAAKDQLAARGVEAPSAGEIRAAQGSSKAMEALKRDYPEFAGAMEAALDEQRAEIDRRMASSAKPADTATPGLTAADLEGLRGELTVELRHPGWQARVKTPEFAGWLQRQEREVQLLANSDATDDAVRLLDLHKAAMAVTPDPNKRRLDAAAALPSGRSGTTVRVKPFEEMTKQEQWAYLDKIDQQNSR